jgi:hypothetical protein
MSSATTSATQRPAVAHRRRASRSSFCAAQAGGKPAHSYFPPSLDGLSLSPTTLVRVRVQTLAYLQDVEARLLQVVASDPDDATDDSSPAERALDDARAWAREGLEMLRQIRADVRAHLPDLADLPDVRAHLPDLPDVRAHLPDMPDLDSLRGRLSTAFADLPSPFDALPTPLGSPFDALPASAGPRWLSASRRSPRTRTACSSVRRRTSQRRCARACTARS